MEGRWRRGGARRVDRLKARPKVGALFGKAAAMLHRKGALAEFLRRTICSPPGPCMGYLSGAERLNGLTFSGAAVPGAACRSVGDSYPGHVFATPNTQVASLTGTASGIVLAAAGVAGLL